MADRLMDELYARECRPLTRLAVLLVFDSQAAEEVVTDAFVAIYRGWRRPRDSEEARPCLRRAVVSKSRAVQRQRTAACGNAQLERSPCCAGCLSGSGRLLCSATTPACPRPR
jgi:DNA-directed RNA polymerase specialized sigma24 family protein